MTDDEKTARALEAQRVLDDPVIADALADIRKVGLLALLNTNATDTETIRHWQAYVGAADALKGQLETYIKQRPQKARGGLA